MKDQGGPFVSFLRVCITQVLQAFEKSSRRGHGLGSFFRRRSKQMRGQTKTLGKTEYGHAVDWFALGCLLYEMCSGSPPKQGPWVASKSCRGLDADVASCIDWLRSEDPSRRCGVRGGLNDLRRAGANVARALDTMTALQRSFKERPRASPRKELSAAPSPVTKAAGTRDWARRRDMLVPPPPTPSLTKSENPQTETVPVAPPRPATTPRVSPDTSPRVADPAVPLSSPGAAGTPPAQRSATPARPTKSTVRDKQPRTPPTARSGRRLFDPPVRPASPPSTSNPPSPEARVRPASDSRVTALAAARDAAARDAADVHVADSVASVVDAVVRAAEQDRSPRATLASAAKKHASRAATEAATAARRARTAAAFAARAADAAAVKAPLDLASGEWSPLRRAVRSRVLALEARITPPASPAPRRKAAPHLQPARGLAALAVVCLGAALFLRADPAAPGRPRPPAKPAAAPRPVPPPDFAALRKPPPQKTCRSPLNDFVHKPTVVVRKRGPLAPLRKLIDLLLLGPLRRLLSKE